VPPGLRFTAASTSRSGLHQDVIAVVLTRKCLSLFQYLKLAHPPNTYFNHEFVPNHLYAQYVQPPAASHQCISSRKRNSGWFAGVALVNNCVKVSNAALPVRTLAAVVKCELSTNISSASDTALAAVTDAAVLSTLAIYSLYEKRWQGLEPLNCLSTE